MSSIRDAVQLNYFLSSSHSSLNTREYEIKYTSKNKKIALIVYIFYKEMVVYCYNYAKNLNNIADIYIVSSNNETLKECQKQAKLFDLKNTFFILKKNKGRDISSFLIECNHVFNEYEYVCYFHDKKSTHLKNKYETQDFFEHCMESILPSAEYARNVISLLDSKPYIGLLVPPPLNWGVFYASEYLMDPGCKKYINQLIMDLDLKVPFDENPVAPYGTMFWVRAATLSPLFKKKWTYDDMPSEPIPPDGTILHAIERIIPFVVQSSGKLTAWIYDENAGNTYLNNCYTSLKALNKEFLKVYPCGRLSDIKKLLKFPKNDKYHEALTFDNYLYQHKMKTKYTFLNFITCGLIKKFKKRLTQINDKICQFKKLNKS